MSRVEKAVDFEQKGVSFIGDSACENVELVEKAARKVASFSCENVEKTFGFIKNHVRFFAILCSVEKFYRWISTFGFVRFASVLSSKIGGFPQFPHSLLLLLNN